MTGEGEILISHRQWNKDFNLFSSLTFGNLIRATRGKA